MTSFLVAAVMTCPAVYDARRMDHDFNGPALHPRGRGGADDRRPASMELVSAVEEMIAAIPGETEGTVKPELMQSVLEIATDVCRSAARGGRPARGPAPARARGGRGEGADDRLGRDASVREVGGPAHRRARALPSRSSTRCASSCGRSCCSACTCTSASTTPTRRSTSPTACACTCRSCWRCRPTRPSGAARRRAGCRRARRSSDSCRASGSRRGSTAGTSTASASSSWSSPARSPTTRTCGGTCGRIRNLGTVEVRSCDAQTRLEHTIAITALIQAMAKELVRALRGRGRAGDLSRRAARREQVAGGALRARGRADRPARRATAFPRPTSPGGWSSASSRTRASWARSASSRASRT